MIDEHFFPSIGEMAVLDVAKMVAGEIVQGDASLKIKGGAALSEAKENDISYIENEKFMAGIAASKAGAILIRSELATKAAALTKAVLIVTADPRLAFANFLKHFYPVVPDAGIANTATVAKSAKIAAGVAIEAGAVIGENVEIGEGSWVRANAVIRNGVKIGKGTIIGSSCVISYSHIGSACVIGDGCIIGGPGFGYVMSAKGHTYVPQMGRVIIEDAVEMGSNCTIDRGALEDTIIGAGTKMDNLVHIAHACKIGKACVIVAQVGVAGSSELGDFVVLAGQAGVKDHLKIGAGSQVGAQAGVNNDLPPMSKVTGTPAVPIKEHYRQILTLRNLAKKGN